MKLLSYFRNNPGIASLWVVALALMTAALCASLLMQDASYRQEQALLSGKVYDEALSKLNIPSEIKTVYRGYYGQYYQYLSEFWGAERHRYSVLVDVLGILFGMSVLGIGIYYILGLVSLISRKSSETVDYSGLDVLTGAWLSKDGNGNMRSLQSYGVSLSFMLTGKSAGHVVLPMHSEQHGESSRLDVPTGTWLSKGGNGNWKSLLSIEGFLLPLFAGKSADDVALLKCSTHQDKWCYGGAGERFSLSVLRSHPLYDP